MSTPPHLFLITRPAAGASLAIPPGASPQAMGFKAYNLLRMALLGLPVPPAFVLGTAYCTLSGQGDAGAAQVRAAWPDGLHALEAATTLRLGDVRRPLLLSVRSGAAVSMPGMMETLLNIGLCDATVPGLLRQTGNPGLVWDAYRRLVATYGEVVHGIPGEAFEAATQARFDGRNERELDFAEQRELTRLFQDVHQQRCGQAFPQDPQVQLQSAIQAVFASWQSEKAQAYRRMNGIADDIGTAVTVQQMVFGNGGGACGAGVGFTRNPSSGEPGLWVDFLFNAQGEDVVSGRRSAHGHTALAEVLPAVWAELQQAAATLEQAFGDMQDIEFTVQDGRLHMLQTRSGKRTALAAARIALDLLDAGLITPELARERLSTLKPEQLAITRVVGEAGAEAQPVARAASASSGVVSGEVALDAARAQARQAAGVNVVLVRRDAETSDLTALNCAVGLLTQRGARTSHAAVVARQLGKVCLVGCDALQIDEAHRQLTLGGVVVNEGDTLTLDGHTGAIHIGTVHTVTEPDQALMARMQQVR
jgi:pyruvate,orthophosphate dikinase